MLKKLFSKWILRLIGVVLLVAFGYAQKVDFYNYAIISGTDTIVFNGNVGDLSAEVFIDYDNIYLVTGADSKIYHCWKVEGTGATYKMGLVYFSWSGTNTYICSDGKRRGVAKLDAGGWIEFDSLEFSGPYLNYFSEGGEYWHSADGFGNGTGYGFSDGIGLWMRNYVSVATGNVRNMIWKWVGPAESSVGIRAGKKADGQTPTTFEIIIKDLSGNNITDLWVNDIRFIPQNNVFFVGNRSGLLFANGSGSINQVQVLPTSSFATGVYSIVPVSGSFSVWVGWSGDGIILQNSTYFLPPFDINLVVNDGNGDGKILIGDEERGNLSFSNIPNGLANLQFVGYFRYVGTGTYSAFPGKQIYATGDFDIKINPVSDFIDNILPVYYYLSGTYDLAINGNLYTGIRLNANTNKIYFYPDKKVEGISIIGNCSYITGDGISICGLSAYLKNSKGYNIPNLKIGDLKIVDLNKDLADTYPYRTFDIDEVSTIYVTGVFLSGFDGQTDNYGRINFYIYSYKPIFNGKLGVDIYNLTGISEDIYDWYQNFVSGEKIGLMFGKAVDLYFSGKAVEEGVLLGADNNVDVVFERMASNISNGKYELSGTLYGCSDCAFEEGGIITGDNFGVKTVNIFITGSQLPEYISYYDKYYSFWVDGNAGLKKVILKPNIRINGGSLVVVGQSFGSKVLGLVSRAIINDGIKTKNIAIVGSKFPFSNFVSFIKRYFYKHTRGNEFSTNWNLNSVSTLNNFIGYYDCGGKIVKLGNGSDIKLYGKNKIFLKDCQLVIDADLLKGEPNAKLEIVDISSKPVGINFSNSNGWQLSSNIYIASNVSQIEADLITDGSIFSLSGDNVTENNIFFPYRRKSPNLQRQLYIHGKIISRNTMGGGYLDINGKVVLPGGKRFEPDLVGLFNVDIKASVIAQAYDINFWRANLVPFGYTTYDTGLVADLILYKYNCQGDTTIDPSICYMPIVVEYDK